MGITCAGQRGGNGGGQPGVDVLVAAHGLRDLRQAPATGQHCKMCSTSRAC